MDIDHARHVLKEINSHKGTPFVMSNEELADEVFTYIKKAFPDALMVKHDIDQYIVVTTRAKNALFQQLEEKKEKHLRAVESIEDTLCTLKKKKGEKC